MFVEVKFLISFWSVLKLIVFWLNGVMGNVDNFVNIWYFFLKCLVFYNVSVLIMWCFYVKKFVKLEVVGIFFI